MNIKTNMLLVNPMCNLCDYLLLYAMWTYAQVVKCLMCEIFIISYYDIEIVIIIYYVM